jgi:hypothetical protein
VEPLERVFRVNMVLAELWGAISSGRFDFEMIERQLSRTSQELVWPVNPTEKVAEPGLDICGKGHLTDHTSQRKQTRSRSSPLSGVGGSASLAASVPQ